MICESTGYPALTPMEQDQARRDQNERFARLEERYARFLPPGEPLRTEAERERGRVKLETYWDGGASPPEPSLW